MPGWGTWRCPVPDYSEFPTTPTAWQEQQLRDWQIITPLSTEDPPRPERRGVDLTALVPGLFFVVLAVVLMAGAVLPIGLVTDGGLLWLVLIGGGVALLVSGLRRARRRRRPHGAGGARGRSAPPALRSGERRVGEEG